jgi:DNA polymerase elongation subunit (family B)
MNLLSADLETAPNEGAVRELFTFDPSKVKFGNTKNEEKRQDIIDEAEANFYPDLIDKAALNPLTAEIIAIGYLHTETGVRIDEGLPEKELIEAFWTTWDEIQAGRIDCRSIVGWNLHGFDLPMLIKRSWILGIKVPMCIRNGRYFNAKLVDLMPIWCGFEHKTYASLDNVARYLGVREPRLHNIQGKDFHLRLVDDKFNAISYLTSDLREAMEIAKRIL